MQVRKLMDFFTNSNSRSLIDFDKIALADIQNNILNKVNSDGSISDKNIEFLVDVFFHRWNDIIDTSHDYTCDPCSGANPAWIQLAIDIADYRQCCPLKILIPSIQSSNELILSKSIPMYIENNPKISIFWFLILNDDNTRLLNTISLSELINNTKSKDVPYWRQHHLSLKTFARIKRKNENYSFTKDNSQYEDIVDYFICKNIPKWRQYGQIPVPLLPTLLHLVELYFVELHQLNKPSFFRTALLSWSDILKNYSIDDINFLYQQLIIVDGKNRYLLDVLLSFFKKNHQDLRSEIMGIARWIFEQDPSLMSIHNDLQPLYEEHSPVITFNELKKQLNVSDECVSVDIRNAINDLSEKVDFSDQLFIERLSKIYRHRWLEIQDTKNDYRKITQGHNALWIRLAKQLTPHYIKMSYEAFLMPNYNYLLLQQLYDIRLSLQTNSLYYDFLGKPYVKFLSSLGCILPINALYAECPRPALYELPALIELYFSDGQQDLWSFRRSLLDWAHGLENMPPDDVYFLYQQYVEFGTHKYFFLDILLNLLYGDFRTVSDNILYLVRWLSSYDASFIAHCSELTPLYSELGVGDEFNKDHLRLAVQTLKTTGLSKELNSHIYEILSHIQDIKKIDDITISKILSMFELRWSEIRGTNLDYTRSHVSENIPWVRLAQQLSGAGLVDANYYRVLIPTLTHDIDPVKLVAIILYPLDHYIFPDASYDSLILLDNCVDYYITHDDNGLYRNYFYNCNTTPPKPFSDKEHHALQFAHKRFCKYASLTKFPDNKNQLISLDTIDALTELVNGSLYTSGLVIGASFTEKDLDLINKAYEQFFTFYQALSLDEQNRLNDQIISLSENQKTVKKIIDDLLNGGCCATSGRFLLKLIIDYVPDRQFKKEIEAGVEVTTLGHSDLIHVGIQEMRAQSARKKIYDADDFPHKAKILMVSLMTESFDSMSWFYSGKSVNFLGIEHRLNNESKCIFDSLLLMIESNNFNQYPDLLYVNVKQALGFNNQSDKMRSWLQSIADGTIFKKIKCYLPEILLQVIDQKFIDQQYGNVQLQNFLDGALQKFAQQNNPDMFYIYINIRFKLLLAELTDLSLKNSLIKRLNDMQTNPTMDKINLHDIFSDVVINQMNVINKTYSNQYKQSFFYHQPCSSPDKKDQSIKKTIKLLKSQVEKLPGYSPKTELLEYLHRIESPEVNSSPSAVASFFGSSMR